MCHADMHFTFLGAIFTSARYIIRYCIIFHHGVFTGFHRERVLILHSAPALIHLSVQMFKYPTIWMFQTALNLFKISKSVIFCLHLGKSCHVRTGCYCPNFISTPISTKYPNIPIEHIHFHTLDDRSRQSIS
jgi:hypothetical protein